MKFKEWLIKESAEDLLQNAEKLADMSCDDVEELLWKGTHGYKGRSQFTSKYSWSIPCKDAIDAIKKWARPPLYDLMAGTGFWAKILNERGVSTIASDIHKFSKFNPYHNQQDNIKKHYKIRRRHALKAVQDIERARETQEIAGDILLGWPPYLETTAFEVLSRLPIGVRVFYFGEGEMGATGDLAMHTSFSRNFKALDHIYIPNFDGIHDQLVIYEKIKDEEIDPKFKGIMAKFDLDDNE
jgi:hypothetical protein